jgi:hypothetical protein
MRRIPTLSTAIVVSMTTLAPAQAAPDLSPLACVWQKIPPAEQQRLEEGFKVDLSGGGFKLIFATSNQDPAAQAAPECQLTLKPAQIAALADGLSRHAAVKRARLGISDRGEKPESADLALAHMNEGKRETIGLTLSCPGPHAMVAEWDNSVKRAVRKANLQLQNQGAYSWVSLAMYAIMAEEGAARRMTADGAGCN